MKYFNEVKSLDELKKAYRRLAMRYHPDRGGDLETMKAINAEHDTLFEQLKAAHNAASDEQHQTTETAEEFRDIINALLKLGGLEVELCGSWLWISGDTRKHREALKAAGCMWGLPGGAGVGPQASQRRARGLPGGAPCHPRTEKPEPRRFAPGLRWKSSVTVTPPAPAGRGRR